MILLFANAALPDPDTIRRTAQEVANRPEFRVRPVRDSAVIWERLWKILRPIFRFFGQLWDISPALATVVVVVLTVICALLIWHILYMLRQSLGRQTRVDALLEGESRKADPAELESNAEAAAARQDFITAVRLLFRAALLRIAAREKREMRPGTTNCEYLRRYAKSEFATPLREFVGIIDAKWYGLGLCDATDFQVCRRAHGQIRAASEVTHLHRA